MTIKQLQSLLRLASRHLARSNKLIRSIYTERSTGRILPSSMGLEVAKADMCIAKIRRAVARPKIARKAK